MMPFNTFQHFCLSLFMIHRPQGHHWGYKTQGTHIMNVELRDLASPSVTTLSISPLSVIGVSFSLPSSFSLHLSYAAFAKMPMGRRPGRTPRTESKRPSDPCGLDSTETANVVAWNFSLLLLNNSRQDQAAVALQNSHTFLPSLYLDFQIWV